MKKSTNQKFQPMNFKDLLAALQDDPVDFAMQKLLIENHKACRHCRIALKLVVDNKRKDGKRWRCPRCPHTESIRRNSLFFASHCSIQQIIELLYWWCIKLPVTQACLEVKCSEPTRGFYYKLFRGICINVTIASGRIGGKGKIVHKIALWD
jgi:hypothetical protein